VSANPLPATTLVDVAVTANEEVVANVRPTVGVHVVVLETLNHGGARGLAGAGRRFGVVDHNIGHGVGQVRDASGRTCTPLRPGNDVGACCRNKYQIMFIMS